MVRHTRIVNSRFHWVGKESMSKAHTILSTLQLNGSELAHLILGKCPMGNNFFNG